MIPILDCNVRIADLHRLARRICAAVLLAAPAAALLAPPPTVATPPAASPTVATPPAAPSPAATPPTASPTVATPPAAPSLAATPPAASPTAATPPTASPHAARGSAHSCIASHDGYLRARVAGAVDADVDWPDRGTLCEGEAKSGAIGVRLSFSRGGASRPNLLFVFGVSGVREGQPAHDAGTNVTLIVQGTSHIYSTRSDTRCRVEELTQRPLAVPHAYRVEARGYCTQPARAVRGDGEVLVSRFDFAGIVNYTLDSEGAAPPR
jgi:hypothetical protein